MFGIGSKRWSGVAKLNEECGELTQVIGKLIATNGERRHWDKSDLFERMEEKIADVYAALDHVVANNPKLLGAENINLRRFKKTCQFDEWMKRKVGG